MSQTDEETGIDRLRAGDLAAFASLVRTYSPMIHALAYRMTGSRAEAEDLAQETFVRAYASLSRFRGRAKFSSWLYRIAVNLCLDWRKREQRRRTLERAWSEDADRSGKPLVRTMDVQEALLRLSPKEQVVIVLTIYDGLSHRDAGRVLGLPTATVSWRAFRARRKLALFLGGRDS